MALVLSLRSGQDFIVGETRFLVERVHDDRHFRVRNVDLGKSFNITDEHATEIMNGVFVSAGDNSPLGVARVVVDAPRAIKVSRGERKIEPIRG